MKTLIFLAVILTFFSCTQYKYSIKQMPVYNVNQVNIPKGTNYFTYFERFDSVDFKNIYSSNSERKVTPVRILEIDKEIIWGAKITYHRSYMFVYLQDENIKNNYIASYFEGVKYDIIKDSCCYESTDLFESGEYEKNPTYSWQRKLPLSHRVNDRYLSYTSKKKNDTISPKSTEIEPYRYTPTTSGPRGGKKVLNSKGKPVYESSTKRKK